MIYIYALEIFDGGHPVNRLSVSLLAIIATCCLSGPLQASEKASLSPKELLGKHLFFDAKLSVPEGQSCAACHAPEVGFTGPHEEINKAGAAYEGAVLGRFGNRKPPTSSYGGDSPGEREVQGVPPEQTGARS